MGFRPNNSDHAIESATFAIRLSDHLTDSDILALNGVTDIRSILPFVSVQQMNFIDVSARMSVPQIRLMLDASIFRADGTAIWNMKVTTSEVMISCTRYTRWAKVWAQVRELFAIVLKQRPSSAITHFATSVTDKFLTDDFDYKLDDLFQRCDWVPPFIFNSGALWHTHGGWFRQLSDRRVLNHFNIDARQEESILTGEGGKYVSVSVVHSQQGEIAPDVDGKADLVGLDGVMEEAHLHNKKVMLSLLSGAIADSIGLQGREKS